MDMAYLLQCNSFHAPLFRLSSLFVRKNRLLCEELRSTPEQNPKNGIATARFYLESYA